MPLGVALPGFGNFEQWAFAVELTDECQESRAVPLGGETASQSRRRDRWKT